MKQTAAKKMRIDISSLNLYNSKSVRIVFAEVGNL